jgi:hypothetical protein
VLDNREEVRRALTESAADADVEAEQQERPQKNGCDGGQDTTRSSQRVEVVINRGNNDSDDDPQGWESTRWPPPKHAYLCALSRSRSTANGIGRRTLERPGETLVAWAREP